MNLRIFAAGAAFGLTVFASADYSQNQGERPQLKSAVAKSSDDSFKLETLEFPAIEGWKMGAKSAIPMERLGIVVSYDSPERERVTVYIYARPEKTVAGRLSGVVKDEFDGAKQALQTVVDAGVYSNLKIEKSETGVIGGPGGSVKSLKVLASFDTRGMKLNSEIFVFPYRGYVGKIRASRPAVLEGTAAYSRLLMELDGFFAK